MKAIRVLVIEDDSGIATLLSEIPSEIGCVVCGIEVTEAADLSIAPAVFAMWDTTLGRNVVMAATRPSE